MSPIPEPARQRPRFVPKVCGIDVSHYQGTINWQLVSIDQNVRYVYIKCTESSGLVDSHFIHNIRQARQFGLPVGVYHFFRPSASPAMQFTNFSQNIEGIPMDLIPIIDVETRGRGSLPLFQKKLKEFLHMVERLCGVRPIIYTGVNFYNKYLAGQFLNYSFMIARYGDDVPSLCDNVDIIMWQFTDQGQISGIHSKVDRSCFIGKHGMQDILWAQP